MTERVEVDGGYGNLIKFVVEVYSSAEHLTEYSLAGGNVAVWLKEPTADYVPSSVRYLSLYLLKQLRLVFLHPFVEKRFVVVENEVGVLVDELGSRAECGDSLG